MNEKLLLIEMADKSILAIAVVPKDLAMEQVKSIYDIITAALGTNGRAIVVKNEIEVIYMGVHEVKNPEMMAMITKILEWKE